MTKQQFSRYASVILDLSLDKKLDYGIPTTLIDQVQPGVKVSVPLRGKIRHGFVHSIKETCDFPSVQPIQELACSDVLITEDIFRLALWMSDYYFAPLSKVLKTILPSTIRKEGQHKEQLYVKRGKTREELANYCREIRNKSSKQAAVLDVMLKQKSGILFTELLELSNSGRSSIKTLEKHGYLTIDKMKIDRSPLENASYIKTHPKKLNPDQQKALKKITHSIEKNTFEPHLLYGVTGSGKTEVYLQAIDKALSLNKTTIMLVPEISLTPQTVERFKSRFEGAIAILHHRLSQGERFDEWHKIRKGEAKIVIGARSAIFSPLPNLGVIIVDEEHESSYKQSEEAPCYNARDIAVMRGRLTNSTVILGSATPSLESFYNSEKGKYTLSKLDYRANKATRPTVKIIDMKQEYAKAQGYTNFSEALLDGIKKRQEVGEQTILFLNRRGYHTVLLCKACGEAVKCNQCDVSLTYHKKSGELSCHLCSHSIPRPKQCPKCRSPETMQFKGVGTEQIEKSLYAIFPDLRVLRVDADTTKHKGSHQKLLRDFGTGKADVLIGTQMIAKGLHFPQVTLVGVLNSDSALNLPDFRSSETVFQLLTQVAGRSGRGAISGEVLIQSCMPEHSTIQLAANQDYEGFYKEEMHSRHFFDYPPYQKIVKVAFSGPEEKEVLRFANYWQERLSSLLSEEFSIHPVVASGYAKIKNRFRFHLLIRGKSILTINKALSKIHCSTKKPREIKVLFDIDTQSTYF